MPGSRCPGALDVFLCMTSMEEEAEEDLPSDLEDMVSLAFLSSNSSLKGLVRE